MHSTGSQCCQSDKDLGTGIIPQNIIPQCKLYYIYKKSILNSYWKNIKEKGGTNYYILFIYMEKYCLENVLCYYKVIKSERTLG